MKDSTTMSAIRDVRLVDSSNNTCRATLYPYGEDTFEVYLQDFNDSVPRRRAGSLGYCQSVVEKFLFYRQQQGFRIVPREHSPLDESANPSAPTATHLGPNDEQPRKTEL